MKKKELGKIERKLLGDRKSRATEKKMNEKSFPSWNLSKMTLKNKVFVFKTITGEWEFRFQFLDKQKREKCLKHQNNR